VATVDQLRVLVVTPSLPFPLIWGSGIRVYQLIRQLSARHNVSLLSYAEAGDTDKVLAMRAICRAVYTVESTDSHRTRRRAQLASLLSTRSYQARRLRSAALQAAVDRLIRHERFDLIQVESSPMYAFDVPPGSTLVLDEHNVEYELVYRVYGEERSPPRKLYNWLEYLKLRREERRCWERADGCVLTSAREEAIVRRHAPGKPTTVVPNGVDLDYFHPTEKPTDPDSIVFTGLIGYRPNTDAVVYFVREILPLVLRERPNATFRVVGAQVPPSVARLAGPHVVVTGPVPDVRPYVERAAVVVVPLRMGSGTRLKLLEGLGMAKGIVTTSRGCEGIVVRDGEHLLVADDAPAFARNVLRLFDDVTLAGSLGQSGRALVEQEYNWTSVATRLEAFHLRMLRWAPAPLPPAQSFSS
jgi:sugar transferase (PEP-CTERM/EpsH1 system associated)